ncbi:MAG: hypothetical protein M3O50_02865 [Myxococcota bacterium]|nr:hypothetical protein [Myxococcota bacterium]
MPPPQVFLCVSIDCECDKGPAWRTRQPLAFAGVHVGLGECLHPLFERFGAKPTYLLSPELLGDLASVERLAGLRGCELGTHLHGELAEPDAFAPDVTSQVQRDYAPEVERAKLTWLTGAFRSAFGRSPGSFRAGRFGIGPNTIGILEQLGYTVESSVTPHVDWSSVSPGLTFVGAPTQPYHPDPCHPGRQGASAMLEVPVTIRLQRWGRLPLLGKRLEPRWLRPTRNRAAALIAIAREAIVEARESHPDRPVVLNAMFHNVEVVAGASPYASTDRAARRIVDRLGALLDFARTNRIACVGLSDIPEVLSA